MSKAAFKYTDELYVINPDLSDMDFSTLSCEFIYNLPSKLRVMDSNLTLSTELADGQGSLSEDGLPSLGKVFVTSEVCGLLLKFETEILMRSNYYNLKNIDYNLRVLVDGYDVDPCCTGYGALIAISWENSTITDDFIDANHTAVDERMDKMRNLAVGAFDLIGHSLGERFYKNDESCRGEPVYKKGGGMYKSDMFVFIA